MSGALKALQLDATALREVVDESFLFGDSRQHALWRESEARGFDAALYCGKTIELHIDDADGDGIEIAFLTDTDVFAWNKQSGDSGNKIPQVIRELITRHGYRVHTDFNRMPKRLRDLLA